jgi:tRNA threonylcarbamoyladenosine biosynthesis protein TsaB
MRILALDAATEACSVALLCNGDLISRAVESGKSNSPQILAMIEELLAEAQLSLGQLDGIAASIGPGAFTGVRISVAVAQGLAFGAGLCAVPVSTLEALALQVLNNLTPRAVACLDARMGEIYWGCFAADPLRGLTAIGDPAVSAPDRMLLPTMERYQGVGRGFSAYPSLACLPGLDLSTEHGRALPHAREVARLGALRLADGKGVDPAALIPLYLRDKVALTIAERAVQSH